MTSREAAHNNIDTYTTYVLKQIMPAHGWRAAYESGNGTYFTIAVDALGLALRREYAYVGDVRIPIVDDFLGGEEDEHWSIVGLSYNAEMGMFNICEEAGNFHGLLPPGVPFQAEAYCLQ